MNRCKWLLCVTTGLNEFHAEEVFLMDTEEMQRSEDGSFQQTIFGIASVDCIWDMAWNMAFTHETRKCITQASPVVHWHFQELLTFLNVRTEPKRCTSRKAHHWSACGLARRRLRLSRFSVDGNVYEFVAIIQLLWTQTAVVYTVSRGASHSRLLHMSRHTNMPSLVNELYVVLFMTFRMPVSMNEREMRLNLFDA